MKILKPILMMLSVGGLSLEYHRSKLQIILYLIWNICMIVYNVDIGLYIIDNIKNISIILQEMLYFIGGVLFQVKAFIYLQHSKSYLHIYENLCTIVDLRQSCGIDVYQKAEKNSRFYFGCYSIAVLICVFLQTTKPLFTVLYKHLIGTLTTDDWLQPNPTYLFNSLSTPEYLIIYLIISIAYYGFVVYASSVDAIFLGIGMYIIYGFRDVQKMIFDINTIINDKHLHNNLSPIIIPKIIDCIKLHTVMLQTQVNLQKITVQAIFLTVPLMQFVICCIIFKITKRTDELLGNTALTGIAVNFMILLYCYVGQLITSESTNVAEAVYNADWYACAPADRKYFLQLIQCSQKYRYFHGYFFHCSMETFSNLLKASFSIAAVMHNLE